MKKALVLLTLGTPAELKMSAVRQFLREYLGDKHVISIPWFFRKILLETLVLPFRARKSFKMYEKVWTKDGSPISIFTNSLREKIQKRLGNDFVVFVSNRSGEGTSGTILKEISRFGNVSEIIAIPQFPQFAESSWVAVVDDFLSKAKKIVPEIPLKIAPPFYLDKRFVAAIVEKFPPKTPNQKFVFSFHGIPRTSIFRTAKKNFEKSAGTPEKFFLNCEPGGEIFEKLKCENCFGNDDCYRRQCHESAAVIANFAGIPAENYVVSFQSRFGHGKWLVPSTKHVVEVSRERENLVVVAPGFTSDCVETLLEISVLGAGMVVPCVNDSEKFADFLAEFAVEISSGTISGTSSEAP